MKNKSPWNIYRPPTHNNKNLNKCNTCNKKISLLETAGVKQTGIRIHGEKEEDTIKILCFDCFFKENKIKNPAHKEKQK